jgi:N-acetylmuramoyl-L-alanine amidase
MIKVRYFLLPFIVLFLSACTSSSIGKNVSENKVAKTSGLSKQINSTTNNIEGLTEANNKIQDSSKGSNNKVSRKVIVIDPGHADKANLQKEQLAPGSTEMKIKDGGGAEGIVTKTPEYIVNMAISMKLRDILQKREYTVIMTKTSNSVSLGNIERAEIGNKAKADLVIRIHADSSDDTKVTGASMLVPAPINSNTSEIYSISKKYGTEILNIYCNEMKLENRGVVEHSDMTGFNWSKVPVVLIEVGFLSNPSEDKLLSNISYENKIANALADGIYNALN